MTNQKPETRNQNVKSGATVLVSGFWFLV